MIQSHQFSLKPRDGLPRSSRFPLGSQEPMAFGTGLVTGKGRIIGYSDADVWDSNTLYGFQEEPEFLNIKASGTGSPAIPSTNRIFRAYPGIPYNIRAAVIGGAYPYRFALSNAPTGMTVNQYTGEINWPDPQTSATDIALSVTDNDDRTTNTSWSITVGTSGFLFVDADYSGTQTGSISQPYSSMANLFSNQTNNINAIVYFRAGTYSMPSGFGSLGSRPHNWIGYPGETVTINMEQRQGVWTEASPYFDSLRFTNMLNHGIHLYGPRHYQTIRRCIYDGITKSGSENHNEGFIPVLASEGTPGYGLVIQDNELKNFTNAQAIGSLYRCNKALIENNYIHSDDQSTTYAQGIGAKHRTNNLTVRGNKGLMSRDAPFSSLGDTSANWDIGYNLFVRTNSLSAWAYQQWEPAQSTSNIYRNTIVGGIEHAMGCDWNVGPFVYQNNVVVNTTGGIPSGSCVTDTDNLKTSNLAATVDADNEYKLVSGQSQYVGNRGWQFGSGSTPMEIRT
jgi:hypothetical protein